MPFHTARDGCRIHYEETGAGPTVLLLPGLGGDGRFWSGVAAGLEADYRILATDHRGAGRSDRPNGAYTLDLIAEDVAGLILAQPGPVHLAGHSTGGAIAQMLAIDPPANLASVVISCSWARSDARFRAMFEARAAMLEAGLAEAYQAMTDALGHTRAHIEENEAALMDARRSAASRFAPLPVTAARVRMLLAHDRLAALPRIALPTLVLAGKDDIMLPVEMSREIAEAIPGARFAALPGAHFHPAATPGPTIAAIRAFLREIA